MNPFPHMPQVFQRSSLHKNPSYLSNLPCNIYHPLATLSMCVTSYSKWMICSCENNQGPNHFNLFYLMSLSYSHSSIHVQVAAIFFVDLHLQACEFFGQGGTTSMFLMTMSLLGATPFFLERFMVVDKNQPLFILG